MAMKAVPKPPTPIPKQAVKEKFEFGPWTCTSTKSHILKSEGLDRDEYEAQLTLPHLPEMVFDKNSLRVEHQGGFGIEFTALDALKMVDDEHDTVKVAEAEEWLAARAGSEHVKRVVKPFDWTYTTEYRGTSFSKNDSQIEITETTERIDMEKLKKREKIHFMADILLFEDELHDCGTSILNVKMRVMPDYFFVLLRFFMRVDQVLIRIYDTRLYHQAGTNYLIRETTNRESRIQDLRVPPNFYSDPVLVSEHLKKVFEKVEKLTFADVSCSGPQKVLAATPISVPGAGPS